MNITQYISLIIDRIRQLHFHQETATEFNGGLKEVKYRGNDSTNHWQDLNQKIDQLAQELDSLRLALLDRKK